MEIERKYLIKQVPFSLESYPSHAIEQAYLCTDPVVRIRKEDERCYLTYKGRGLMAREEYNLPLTEAAYLHLREKADGRILSKQRFLIPLADSTDIADTGLTIELDRFHGVYEGLLLAEVEFPSEEAARSFTAPDWFSREVTFSGEYQNSRLSLPESQPELLIQNSKNDHANPQQDHHGDKDIQGSHGNMNPVVDPLL